MSEFLYITEQGSQLRKAGQNLVVSRDETTFLRAPARQLKQVICLGNVTVSPAALSFCMSLGIDILFITRWGRLKGVIQGFAGKNAILRNSQYMSAADPQKRLRIAREIVVSKALNYKRWIGQYLKYSDGDFFRRAARFVKNSRRIDDLDRLRGYEGNFSRLYFSILPELVKEDFGFKKRIKHPPVDPLNVLLSFAYTLLFQTVYAVITGVGLDPYRGFYHDISYGHPALVSDLMEEFRAIAADHIVVSLINKGKIRREHFFKEDKRIILARDGVSILVKAYADNLARKRSLGDRYASLTEIILHQVKSFCKAISHKEIDYKGYRLK